MRSKTSGTLARFFFYYFLFVGVVFFFLNGPLAPRKGLNNPPPLVFSPPRPWSSLKIIIDQLIVQSMSCSRDETNAVLHFRRRCQLGVNSCLFAILDLGKQRTTTSSWLQLLIFPSSAVPHQGRVSRKPQKLFINCLALFIIFSFYIAECIERITYDRANW